RAVEGWRAVGLRRVRAGGESELLEIPPAFEVTEDRLHLAHHQLEEVDALVEDRQDALLDRAGEAEVEDLDGLGLPDAVQPADALLDPHRVPRQVEVDQAVAELEVEPLAADVGRQQDAPITTADRKSTRLN